MNLRELLFRRGGKDAQPSSSDLRPVLTNGDRRRAWNIGREYKIVEQFIVLPHKSNLGDVVGPGMPDYLDSVRTKERELNEKYSEQEDARIVSKLEIKGIDPTGKCVFGENTALVVVKKV
ncbi:MAG: hypothetical protein Q7R53_01425 [bacterium]|nr:hypothetical protein [bacterium]